MRDFLCGEAGALAVADPLHSPHSVSQAHAVDATFLHGLVDGQQVGAVAAKGIFARETHLQPVLFHETVKLEKPR